MIDRVQFKNFKSLQDVSIELGRLTVLVGMNGCGKTSVLQGINLLAECCRPYEREWKRDWQRFGLIFDGRLAAHRLVTPGHDALTLVMRDANGDEITLWVSAPPAGQARPEVGFRMSVTGNKAFDRPIMSMTKVADYAEDFAHAEAFGDAVYLHLDAPAMALTSVPEDEEPQMGEDGSGLASTLAWMKGAAEDDLAKVTADLALIVPGVKRIRSLRERVPRRRMETVSIDGQPVWRPVDESPLGDRFEIEFDSGASVPADLLSEGTVIALGLMTKLREPQRPRLVLLDDIDRGLHIEAQAKLVGVLRRLLELDPTLQIVCTSHSPYLLDLFKPEEVRVLALDNERHTHAMPLTGHPDFGKWKFGTQTGELWAALGNAWVTLPAKEAE